jgi:eukaryotic-like serine/threonine-protein kinase
MEKIGKYKIVKELGHGATSTVFLAIDLDSNQQVAIKLFNLDVLLDNDRAKAFRKLLVSEASLVGKLSHPHIVKIYDAVMDDSTVNYIVMEYVEGESLEKLAGVDHLLPLSNISEIIYKCCKALEYAQYQGVIHRDIKPANIMICGDHDIKISDFGSALIESQQTTQVSGVGSPAYMSPEQIREQILTHQTDIYSLAVTMYRLLTGKLPFDARNNYSMIYQIMNIEPPPPSTFRPEIPQLLDEIVMRAMHKDVTQRYQTWDEFARNLVGFFSKKLLPQEEKVDTEKFDTLRALAFFNKFSDVELWEVLRISEWRDIAKDETVFADGDEGQTLFVIAHGTVKVLKQGRLMNLLHAGDCFGEMANFAERKFTRTSDVVAKNKATLIEIKLKVLEKTSAECRYQFSDSFVRMLVKRLAIANTRISHLLAEHSTQSEE